MQPEALLKRLVQRETELERKRTRSLARQLWSDVIEAEAQIAECKLFRKWLVEESEREQNDTPTPTTAVVR